MIIINKDGNLTKENVELLNNILHGSLKSNVFHMLNSTTTNCKTTVQVSPKGSNKYKLAQNHPNPFNPTTTINYSIPNGGHVKLVVFNTLGEEIKTLVDRYQNPGEYESILNASNLQSGVYLYQLQVNDFITVKKKLLLK